MVNKRSIKEERGTTLVEFSAVLIILLTLTFGMIDFGRYVYTVSAIRAAAQEGARAGIKTDVDEATAEAAAESQLISLDLNRANVSVEKGTEIVEATVTYQFEFVTPFLAAAMPVSTIEISGTASAAIY